MEYNYKWRRNKFKKILFLIAIIIIISVGFYEMMSLKVQEAHISTLAFHSIVIDIIIFYYMVVIVHELGHVVVGNLCGYTFRVAILGPFVLIKNKARYKLKIKLTPILFSGLTIINLRDYIRSEDDYKKFIKNFKFITLGGVIFNLIFCIIGLIIMKFTKYIGFSIAFMNFINIMGCCYSNGDIEILNKLKNKSKDYSLYLLEELKINSERNSFLEKVIEEYIDNKLMRKSYDADVISAIGAMVEYSHTNKRKISREIEDFLRWFIENKKGRGVRQGYLIRLKEYNLLSILYKCNIINNEYLRENNIRINKQYSYPLYKIYKELNDFIKEERGLS